MNKLTHVDKKGKANMVDVSEKKETLRTAEASAEVFVSNKVFQKIKKNQVEKGDVLSTAQLAGIQAAKKTSELIPLCHNIFVSKVGIDFKLNPKKKSVEIKSFVSTNAKTGVEMEALTAVTIAALTIYDMCKAIDKSIVVKNIVLLSKTGGKSGDYFFKGNL